MELTTQEKERRTRLFKKVLIPNFESELTTQEKERRERLKNERLERIRNERLEKGTKKIISEDEIKNLKEKLRPRFIIYISEQLDDNKKFQKLYDFIADRILKKNEKDIFRIIDYPVDYEKRICENFAKLFLQKKHELYVKWLVQYAEKFALGLSDPENILRGIGWNI